MKLERLQEYVLPVVATLAGMAFAGYLGYLMGQGQVSRVVMLLGLLFLGFLTMVMRQYIWLLLVVAWPWAGIVPGLPMSMSVRDVSIMAVFASFLALRALKVVRRKPTYDPADLVMILMLVYMLTVFVRNPVGVLATNSFRIGGRPYFNIFLACAAYSVLSRASIPFKNGSRIVIFSILGSSYVLGALNILADFSPRAARFLTTFYLGFSVTQETDGFSATMAPTEEVVERLDYLGGIGGPTITALTSFFRPLTLLNPLYIGRFMVLMGCLLCLMLSGFRSALISTAAYFVISTYLRSGWEEIVRMGVLAAVGLVLLVAGQGRLFELPLSAQRSLSFLPGHWNQTAVESANTSSEWRYEMWRVFLKGNKYVQNQVLGDGFGLTKRDLAAIAFLQQRGGGDSQETTLIIGNVHSGPLSTVRYAGYVGVVIHVTLLVLVARYAWRLARKTQGTPYFPLALFIGLPLIYEPFNFVFIFGGFDSSLPTTIYNLGLLKMVENTVNDHLGLEREAAPVSNRRIADPRFALAGAHR